MAKDYTLLIGTVGQGLNLSADGGSIPRAYRSPGLQGLVRHWPPGRL